MNDISKKQEQEILARSDQLTDRRRRRIEQVVSKRQRDLMVIMEDVHNPHNLAAIARSCDAFGVQQIAFTVQEESLFDPKEVGKVSSTSASKWLDYRIFDTGTDHALTTLKREGWHVMVTVLDRTAPTIYDVDFTAIDRLALLVGNEHAGVSQTAIKHADSKLYIPMFGMIQSFNVSVATALMLFEITRQRMASPIDFTLDEEARARLIADFMQRALR